MKYYTAFFILISFNLLKAQRLHPVKRALDPSIDLNRTPSPEPEFNVSKPQELVESVTAKKKNKKEGEELKPKKEKIRKIYPTKHQRIKQAFNNRFKLHPYNEEKRKAIEEEWQSSLEQRKLIHNRCKKRMWERIKTGKPTEFDLKSKERSNKSSIIWRKAHPEKIREYQRKRKEKKKKKTS